MYEHLEKLHPKAGELLEKLVPISEQQREIFVSADVDWPEDYLAFLYERGLGLLQESDAILPILDFCLPIDAAKDHYCDDLIYEFIESEGALGVVWIFAFNSQGHALGFDSGDGWRLMFIDNDRCIIRLDLTFRQFIEGVLVCYPDRPLRHEGGVWWDWVGEAHAAPVEALEG